MDNYIEAIESLGENSSARQNAVQAARTFLAENHVNLSEDATDDEILRAAMDFVRANRVETSEDAATEEKAEGGTGESVAGVSAGEQEAAAQDAE